MQKIIIAAIALNRVIGGEGSIPWRSKEEMAYFKATTMGHPVIMGRKTFESLKKPLVGRLNIVITRNPDYFVQTDKSTADNSVSDNSVSDNSMSDNSGSDGLRAFTSIEEAIEYCRRDMRAEKVFIIGGGEIYRQTLPVADELSISEMKFEAEGDVFFPEISEKQWDEVSREEHEEFTVVKYKRKTTN